MRTIWKTMLAVAAASAVAISSAPATTVQPIVIDLNAVGNGTSRTITVENTNASRLPVEIRVESLAFQDDGVRVAGPSSDLAVFPAQAVIEPGRTQTFRVQWAGGPLDRGKSYYVTVAQAPVTLPAGQSAIQVLYNFQVLVSVAPPQAQGRTSRSIRPRSAAMRTAIRRQSSWSTMIRRRMPMSRGDAEPGRARCGGQGHLRAHAGAVGNPAIDRLRPGRPGPAAQPGPADHSALGIRVS